MIISPEYDPAFYKERIDQAQERVGSRLNIIAAAIAQPWESGVRVARGVVCRLEDQLKGSSHKFSPRERLAQSKEYQAFAALDPGVAEATVGVIEDRRQIAADRRRAKELTHWQDYFDNQAQRDTEIAKLLQTTRQSLKDNGCKEERNHLIKEAVKAVHQLAPEQVIKTFLAPERYHPRKFHQKLLEKAGKSNYAHSRVTTVAENQSLRTKLNATRQIAEDLIQTGQRLEQEKRVLQAITEEQAQEIKRVKDRIQALQDPRSTEFVIPPVVRELAAQMANNTVTAMQAGAKLQHHSDRKEVKELLAYYFGSQSQ